MTHSEKDGAVVLSPAKIAADLKAARTAWLESHGVPISWEFARFAEAIGVATDYLEQPEPQRCGNCDHHTGLHNVFGCTVRIQMEDGETTIECPCEWNKFQAGEI